MDRGESSPPRVNVHLHTPHTKPQGLIPVSRWTDGPLPGAPFNASEEVHSTDSRSLRPPPPGLHMATYFQLQGPLPSLTECLLHTTDVSVHAQSRSSKVCLKLQTPLMGTNLQKPWHGYKDIKLRMVMEASCVCMCAACIHAC